MSLVIAHELSVAYGPKVLFEKASFTLGPRDRVGLVGANGTGKSTLMKILAGLQPPDSGELRFSRNARAGYLPQEIAQVPSGPLVETVLASVPGRGALEDHLRSAEADLAGTRDEKELLELSQTLADLHHELDHFEERFGRHHAERILAGLGFRERDFTRETASFSGGWRMRAALAGLLLQDPDLLLLDEPTNHLDLPTLEWFDSFLLRSSKALVLISHDRAFLNRQIGRVLALEVEGLRAYSGNYDAYRAAREQEVEQRRAAAARQQQKRAQTEAFIERFRAKNTKASQVQSRIKQLEKEEIIEVVEEREKVRFRFPPATRSGREVVKLEKVRKAFGDNVVYDGVDATILRGQRVAVVGVNGAGKTTLLKIVAGELPPDAGTVTLGHNVTLGYYAQHHAETLDKRASILEEVFKLVPDKPQSFVRGVLGAFLFSGDDVDKPIGVLSGGERARVALAKLLVAPANFLVMDEPTNHLDLDSSEALIEALAGYDGTLLFVSHNKSFLNRLATDVWDVKDQKAVPFPGNLDDYLHHLKQQVDAEVAKDQPSAPARSGETDKERKRREAEERQRRSAVEGPLKKQIAALEAQIAALEAAQKEREAQLADPVLYNDFARAKPIMDAHREGKDALDDLYARWEDAQQRLAAVR